MIIHNRPLIKDQYVEIKFQTFLLNNRPLEFEQVIFGFIDTINQKEIANGKWQIDSIEITQIIDLEDYYTGGSKFQSIQINLVADGSFSIRPILKVKRK